MAYVWNASGKFYIGLTSDTRPDYTDIGAILHEIDLVNGIRRTYQTHDRGSTWTEISNGLLTPNTEGTLHAIAPTKANTVGGVYMATPPTYNDGDLTVLRTNVNGDQVVQLSGSYVEIGGVSFAVSGGDTLRNTAANKPNADAAHAAIPFCYYHAIDTGAIEVTDGTNWVVI